MANFIARAVREQEQKQVPLPKVQAEVTIDGSLVTFTVDLDEVAKVAVEREGERVDTRSGAKVEYTKNPAVMLVGIAKGVQVCQIDPATGREMMLEVDFVLGQGGNGVYANFPRTKLIGEVADGKGVIPAVA